MGTLICPNCRSTNLRRSRAHGLSDTVQKFYGRRPFRCRDCGWRGLIFSPGRRRRQVFRQRAYVFAAIFSVVILLMLIVFNFRPDVIERIFRQLIGK